MELYQWNIWGMNHILTCIKCIITISDCGQIAGSAYCPNHIKNQHYVKCWAAISNQFYKTNNHIELSALKGHWFYLYSSQGCKGNCMGKKIRKGASVASHSGSAGGSAPAENFDIVKHRTYFVHKIVHVISPPVNHESYENLHYLCFHSHPFLLSTSKSIYSLYHCPPIILPRYTMGLLGFFKNFFDF